MTKMQPVEPQRKKGGRKRPRARQLMPTLQQQIPLQFEFQHDSEWVAERIGVQRADVLDSTVAMLLSRVRQLERRVGGLVA